MAVFGNVVNAAGTVCCLIALFCIYSRQKYGPNECT